MEGFVETMVSRRDVEETRLTERSKTRRGSKGEDDAVRVAETELDVQSG